MIMVLIMNKVILLILLLVLTVFARLLFLSPLMIRGTIQTRIFLLC